MQIYFYIHVFMLNWPFLLADWATSYLFHPP
jgi:hypothetical protein